ncbi:MAG: alpha/beta fold hydrolase [Candidatus Hodarchaeota archaeon]
MSKEIIKKALKNFGLTEKEAEIYIFLAKHGVLTAGEISKQTKTHRPIIYRILKSLQKKGLVEATLESPVRFSSVPFEEVLDENIRRKQEETTLLEKSKNGLLKDWNKIYGSRIEPDVGKFFVIEGNRKIYSKIFGMIKQTKSQFSAILTVPELVRNEQFGVFDAIYTHPRKSKIKFQFLTELSDQNLEAIKLLNSKLKPGFDLKARNPSPSFSLLPRMVIRDKDEILFFVSPKTDFLDTGQNEICICTNNASLVQTLTGIFDEFWPDSTDINEKIFEIEMGKLPAVPHLLVAAEESKSEWLIFKTIQYYLQALELMKDQKKWQKDRIKVLEALGGLYGLVSEHEKANECYQKGIASADDDSVKERIRRKIRWKKIVENDGVKLSYYIYGKGEKTLFFLAWTGTDRLWTPQVNHFAQKYKVVTMDMRGTGESEKPPGEYTVDLFMDDFRTVIEDLPDKKIIFVGLYIGGMVGIKYVTKYPGRISKLILLSVGPKPIRSDDYPDGLIQRHRAEQFYVQALKSPSWGVKKLAEFYFPKPEDKHFRERYLTFSGTPPEIVINALMHYNEEDVRPLLGKITIPTLVLGFPQMAKIMKSMSEKIPGSEYHEFKTRIFPNLFEAEEFNKILENFINRD